MVDVDRLASMPDRYGQSTADAMLKEVARAMHSALRPYDAVGRYGAQEFLIVLPDTDRNAATTIAKRLRRKVEACTVEVDAEQVSCAVSTGIASIEQNAGPSPVDTLVAKAENALLLAKRGGGDGQDNDHDRLSDFYSRRLDGPDLESTDDRWLGNPMVVAQLARLRAHVVDD